MSAPTLQPPGRMRIVITPYLEEHEPAVRDFNRRMRAGGAPADVEFSESHIPEWLPHTPGAPVYNEFFLALEGSRVRGAYVVKRQDFSFHGKIRPAPFYHHPISEAVVDKTYAPVGLQMMMHVLRENPALYALGMAGYDRPLPRMLMALKWKHCLVPFYFRVLRPARFLRQMRTLRTSAWKRMASDAAAFTGTGWAAIGAAQMAQRIGKPRTSARAEAASEFDDWADRIWKESAPVYAMIGVRNCAVLRTLYPASNARFLRLRVAVGSRIIGWAAAAISQMRNHQQYGNLRVAVILDGLAAPENAAAVIAAATRALEEHDVDMIASNQSHQAWIAGLKGAGFLRGPSNYIFAASPKLSEWMQPFDAAFPLSHLTRGDGDNLMQYNYA